MLAFRNPNDDEKLAVAEAYTVWLTYQSWKYGKCDDDIIVIVSKDDGLVGINHLNYCNRSNYEKDYHAFLIFPRYYSWQGSMFKTNSY